MYQSIPLFNSLRSGELAILTQAGKYRRQGFPQEVQFCWEGITITIFRI
jgi:hypothetical protein